MQASIQRSETDAASTTEHVNIQFSEEEPGEVVDVPADIKAENPHVFPSTHISKFLNRPVLIYNYSWTLGSTTVTSFDPWNLYFNYTSIKKKLDNYYLLRSKLHLKFVINASPFHYGSLLAAYKPMYKAFNPAPIDSTIADVSEDFRNVAYSQLPRVYIYPQTSQGGELTLPFLYHKEWLDITSATDVTNMGTIFMRPITPLSFANAGTGVACNIQVFAWAEDVDITGPTVKLAMQSYKDEYNGPISGPASALAYMSGLLEKVPSISPFATATRMVSSTVADVAKMFGFTNVPVITDVHEFTPAPFPQFASPEIGTQIEKLTLDPKNELTIDPCAVGIDVGDECLISSFTKRETYLTQFPWTIANAPDDILFSIAVTPQYERNFITSTSPTQTVLQYTPLSMCARMFSYWRGDIKIRFKVVCSQFHRGRLRISWDPVGAIGSTANSTTEVFTQIIDLADCTDTTFNVPFMQDTAFNNCRFTSTQYYSNNGSTTNVKGVTNGVLTARVLTDLSAPLNTADIQVLVFVSGGDNLEFAGPSDINLGNGTLPTCAFPQQSLIEKYDVESEQLQMGDTPSEPPSTSYLTYHGEVVKSVRTLMRRTGFHTFAPTPASLITSTVDGSVVYNNLPRYPAYPGFSANGYTLANKAASGTQNFFYVRWHPITWFSQCFLGCKGAINYRFNVNTKLDVAAFYVTRSPNKDLAPVLTTSGYSNLYNTSATNSTPRQRFQWSDNQGLSLTNTKTNTGLNVSIPYYSRFKFRNVSPAGAGLGLAEDETTRDYYSLYMYLNPSADSNATSTYKNVGTEIYIGAGTDYSPIFFLNVPTLYIYTTLPTTA